MSQKSILSFFKQSPTPSTNGISKTPKKMEKLESANNNDNFEDSPIKLQKKRKRLKQIIESDDESDNSTEIQPEVNGSSPIQNEKKGTSPNKEACTNAGSGSKSKRKKIKLDTQDSSPKSEQSPTNVSSKQQSKRKRTSKLVDSEEEGDTSTTDKKVKLENGLAKGSEESLSNSISSEDRKTNLKSENELSSTSNKTENETLPEFIPKRKTARKQMRGGQMRKENVLKVENSSTSSEMNSGSNAENNSKSKNESNISEETKADTVESQANSHAETENKVFNKDSSTNEELRTEGCKTIEKINKSPEKEELEKSSRKDAEKKKKTPQTDKTKKVLNSSKKGKSTKTSKATEKSKTVEKVEQDSEIEDTKPVSDEEKTPETDSSKIKEAAPSSSKKNLAIHPFFAPKKSEDEETSLKDGVSKKTSSKDKQSLTQSQIIYDPSKSHYHPIDDAFWKHNEKVPYLALAKTLELIENTSARLKMIEILANFLRSVIVLSPEDLLYSVYLCLNRLAPEYEGVELGIGETLLMKAVAQATGRTVEKIKAEVSVKGDLGLVAESSRGNQRIMFAPPKLTVASVFTKFKEIAKMSGNAAMSKKTDKIQALFVACRECEAKYIIRSLSGKLRIGLAEQSVLAALARAAVLTPPNQSYPPEIINKSSKMSADSFKEYLNAQTLILKTTYCECPNFDRVIPVLLKEGIEALPLHCQLLPGCPLKPMLAHPTNGIDEVLKRFDKNEFTCEYKYDGERAQIHMTEKGEVKVFSRNQEDNTSKYPDVLSRISKALKETTKSFILDSEAVAWDCETKQILPFQVLSTRKKKDAVESDIVVQVCIMAFDLLYLNGESLVKKTLKERRELLHSSFIEIPDQFMFVNYRDGDSAETMQEFLDESVKGNCEGLMIKALTADASYEIAKRSHNWLKLKKDYLKGIGDTLDLVVIGGYHGKGKRTGTYGGFLLACYDEENEEFQSICKLGTGFSEEELDTHTEFLKQHVIKGPKSYYRYDSSLEPDEWFEPVQIWEIKCADLSISPVHKAALGIVDPEKGISLRFPRFLKIREDKTKPEDCTVATQIAEMYQKQEQVQNTMNKNIKSEEDYY